MSEKPRKRLVTWKEYALRKSLAIALSIGLTIGGVGGVILLLGLPYGYYVDAQYRAENGPPSPSDNIDLSGLGNAFAWWLCLRVLPVLVIIGLPLWWGSRKIWKTVRALQPINFADTTALPEVETLVRASDIPLLQERAELLRMAAPNTQTPPEELLRATTSAGPTAD